MNAKSNCSSRQGAQRLDSRPDLQLDAVGDFGALPRVARDGRPLLADVAAQQLPAGAEAARDRERGVPGERAHLDRALGAHRPHDDLHQHGLVVADLHHGAVAGLLAGDLLQLDLVLIRPRRVRGGVLVDRGIGEPASSASFHGGHSTTACETHTVNRLANETSPYLRQHADNPVDWYPWGDEAFARRAPTTSRSCCRSATRRVTGAT